MKRVIVAALVVAVGVSLGSLGYKAWVSGPGTGDQTNVKALRSFQKETLPLRDELAVKGLELRNEHAKESPDQKQIASLQKEMIDLRAKIQEAAQKSGLADRGPGWMAGQGGWGHGTMMGQGYGPDTMMGRGYGRGFRGGEDGYNCPMW
jgi:hypothetical protein